MYSKLRRAFITLGLFSALTAHAAGSATDIQASAAAEAEYFKTRDNFRQQSAHEKTHSIGEEARQVAVLERQIKAIIGPVEFRGFPKEGRPTIRIISDDPCCDRMDALFFTNPKEEILFVTTRGLLDNYMARHPDEFRGLTEPSGTENYYLSAIAKSNAIANFSDIPVQNANGKYFTRAFLGEHTNEGLGATPPDKIFVYASQGNRLFIFSAPTTIKVPRIQECQEKWDGYEKKARPALASYYESDRKYKQFWDVSVLLQNAGFKAFYTCYQKKSKSMPFFPPLSKQAQSVADRLPSE